MVFCRTTGRFYKPCHRKLTKVTLSESLEEIGEYAFSNCTSLESIDFPSSLKRIYKSAFESTGLKEARLNEGLLYVSARVFSSCPNLTTIYLPKSLRWISWHHGDNAPVASNCDALEKIVVPEGFQSKIPKEAEESYIKERKLSSLFSGKKIAESVALQKELDAYPTLQCIWVGQFAPAKVQREFYSDIGF